MITSLRNILENKHTLIEETSYCAEQKELFDYPIVSGDFYEIGYQKDWFCQRKQSDTCVNVTIPLNFQEVSW